MKQLAIPGVLVAVALAACTEQVGDPSPGAGSGGAAADAGAGLDAAAGDLLSVEVPEEGTVLIDLDEPAVLATDDTNSRQWELAFSGYDVLTNSGVSGPGSGGAFGPLAEPTFSVPFVFDDATGGAFLRWYAYESAVHALWSRYHIYGVRDGDDYYKVQVLSYYGEVQGAPISAIYGLRWAAVEASGSGPVREIDDLDGTAGGLSGTPSDPSGCLDLATGDRSMLTVSEARDSSAWHLCFRRDSIQVNGELGGPRGVGAVDLSRHLDPEELPLEDVKAKTARTEQAVFDAIGFEDLIDPSLIYRGDRVVSAFGTAWYEPGQPPRPAGAIWLVRGAGGESSFFISFTSFDGATEATPGTVDVVVQAVTQ